MQSGTQACVTNVYRCQALHRFVPSFWCSLCTSANCPTDLCCSHSSDVAGVDCLHQLIASLALLPLGSQRQAETPSACEVYDQRLELPAGQRRLCCLDVGGSHLCCDCAQQVLAPHPQEHSTLGMFSWSARRFLPSLAAGCVASLKHIHGSAKHRGCQSCLVLRNIVHATLRVLIQWPKWLLL